MLFLDGVYSDSPHGFRARFRGVKATTNDEITQLTHIIARHIARYLERQGLASIEDPAMIKKILAHLDDKAAPNGLGLLPECRAPPQKTCLRKTIIQTISCYKLSGTMAFALRV